MAWHEEEAGVESSLTGNENGYNVWQRINGSKMKK